MKKIGKILGLFILGLALLAAIAGFAITRLFDPNDYKSEIQQLARDKAGLVLTLKGDIRWSLFPWLGLELNDARVASPASAETPFAHVQALGLSVRVLPLLRREIQMSGVQASGLNVMLVRDAAGHGNWEGIGVPEKNDATPDEKASSNGVSPLAIHIDSVKVVDSQISYQDTSTGAHFEVTDVMLTSGAIITGKPIPLTLSGRFDNGNLTLQNELDGIFYLNTAAQHYRLENFKWKGEASGKPFNGKTMLLTAEAQLAVDLDARTAEAQNLKITAGTLHANGDLKANHFDQALKWEGTLTATPFDLRRFLTDLGITLPAMAGDTALSTFSFQSQLAGTADNIRLSNLRVSFDETALTGTLAIDDFSQPALRIVLKGNTLNVDRYLPPKKKTLPDNSAPLATAQSSALQNDLVWRSEPILPLATLRTLNVDADIGIETLTFQQMQIRNAITKISGKKGLLTFDVLQGTLLDGRFNLKSRIDARQDIPQLSVQGSLNGVAIEKISEAQGNKTSPLQGKLNLTMDLTTRGNSEKAWIDNLGGNAQFEIVNGVLRGLNIEQQLCQAIALVNRKTLTTQHDSKDTHFQESKGSLKIDNGVARNPDLKIRIPGVSSNGHGDFDLRTLGIDYRISVLVANDQKTMPDPACQINKNYAGIEWPLRCKGSLLDTAKACGIDREGVAKIAAQLAGNKLIDKIDDKLGDKAPAGIKDALKGLFKR